MLIRKIGLIHLIFQLLVPCDNPNIDIVCRDYFPDSVKVLQAQNNVY